MHRIILVLFSLLALGISTYAQSSGTNEQIKSLFIINGLFFSEKPEQPPHDVSIQMGMLKDDKFGKIVIMNYDTPLSNEALALAIPVDRIENGADILERSKSAMTFASVLNSDQLNIKAGDLFPVFNLKDNKGNEWSLKDFAGKKVVINFWYTGCKPCRKEMPELGGWVSKHPDVLFVAITYESAETIEKIVAENGFHFHQLVDADDLVETIGVGSYPLTLVLDESSRIVLLESGTTPVQRARILRAISE